MTLTPNAIYQDLLNKKIDTSSAINLLIYLIDSIDNPDVRVHSIDTIGNIGQDYSLDGLADNVFDVLENLLISDSSESVRSQAADTIRKIFIGRALPPMKWVLEHDKSTECLVKVIKTLGELNTEEAREILIEQIKSIESQKNYEILDNFERLTNLKDEESLILSNYVNIYRILNYFNKKIIKVYFEMNHGQVTDLDLSNPMYQHVFGWSTLTTLPNFISEFKYLKYLNLRCNRLFSLPLSLKSLNYLAVLDLGWNEFTSIPDWICTLPSLKVIYIIGNQIESLLLAFENNKNIKIIKQSGIF